MCQALVSTPSTRKETETETDIDTDREEEKDRDRQLAFRKVEGLLC